MFHWVLFQFPLHDCDPGHIHRKLTEEEEEAMNSYVDYCQKEAVGQGIIAQKGGMGSSDSGFDGETLTPRSSISERNGKKDVNGDAEWWPPPPTQQELSLHHPTTPSDPSATNGHTRNGTKENSNSCEECGGGLKEGDILVTTQHSGPDVSWHPNCFKCCECEKVLVDMLYFCRGGKYFCGRHFGDTMFPRCFGCDEFTRAEGHDWHLNHFCCFGCDTELGGHKYMVREENPYCINCYLSHFARVCSSCEDKIGPDVKRISHKDLHWHATEKCFLCVECRKTLLGERFMIKQNQIFCSSNCKNNYFLRITDPNTPL